MSELLDAQQEFFDRFCRWGVAARFLGYRFTFGDAYRDPRATFPYSSPRSLHAQRLAIDVNAFLDGKLLTTLEEWDELGRLWLQVSSPDGTWGGAFQTGARGDANHLSWGEGRNEA